MLEKYVQLEVWKAVRKNKAKKGQSLAEYGLILGLIAVVAIAALTTMGGEIQNILNKINAELLNVNSKTVSGGG